MRHDAVKLVCISDAHEKHEGIAVPAGDILIFAGDMTMLGARHALERFNSWLGNLPHRHKIAIFGNHEVTCDPAHPGYKLGHADLITNAIVLNDSGCEIDGLKFWGSPITANFNGWAFNRARGAEIDQHWQLIPDYIDVLITHGPPSYVLDTSDSRKDWEHFGCERLLLAVERVKPQAHIFGHIHGGYGQRESGGTKFVNASVVDECYRRVNEPIVLEISVRKTPHMSNKPGVSSEPATDAGTPELTLEAPKAKPKQTDFNREMFP